MRSSSALLERATFGNVFLRRNGMQASMITRELRRSLLGVVAHRIERRAPAAVDDVDLIARVAARAHRPDHVVEVGRVDVVVDHDGPAIVVGAGVAVRGHHRGLLGVAAVQRLDRDHQHEAAAAGLMRPYALHAGDAGGLELVPDRTAAVGAEIEGVVVRRHRRDRADQDRIVAVHQRVDADRWLEVAAARVVAGPFAERAFLDPVVGMDQPLEGNLRVRRHRQAGLRHVDDLDGFAEDSARGLELVRCRTGISMPPSITSAGCMPAITATGHGSPALVILPHDDQPVLAGRHHHRRGVRLVRLHAVGAVVHPAASPGPSSPRGRRCR